MIFGQLISTIHTTQCKGFSTISDFAFRMELKKVIIIKRYQLRTLQTIL